MFKIALALVCLLLWPHDANAKEWSEREKEIFTYYAILSTVDTLQSMSAMRDPCECFREANPIFGEHISDEEAIGATLVSWGLMYWMIENDAPEWTLWTAVGLRAGVVINNHSVGAEIRFDF